MVETAAISYSPLLLYSVATPPKNSRQRARRVSLEILGIVPAAWSLQCLVGASTRRSMSVGWFCRSIWLCVISRDRFDELLLFALNRELTRRCPVATPI